MLGLPAGWWYRHLTSLSGTLFSSLTLTLHRLLFCVTCPVLPFFSGTNPLHCLGLFWSLCAFGGIVGNFWWVGRMKSIFDDVEMVCGLTVMVVSN